MVRATMPMVTLVGRRMGGVVEGDTDDVDGVDEVDFDGKFD